MRYRITAPTGQVVDEGEGSAALTGGAIVVSPSLGQPLRLRPSDVVEIGEPEPYVVQLRLADGHVVDLLQLGALRTQVLAEFSAARTADTVSTLLLAGIGRPEIFPGAVGGVEAELRLYDDALVAVPVSGAPEQVPYSFIESVDTDPSGYRILIGIGEGTPLEVQRLARRTTEFVDLLKRRVTAARGRTSAFLAALLPGLGPLPLRTVGGLLRDGLAARRADLDGVDPTVWPALLEACALPDRARCAAALASMGDLSLGFKQLVSVEAAGSGGGPTPTHTPQVVVDHGGGSSFGSGLQGMLGAELAQSGVDAISTGQPAFGPAALGFDGPLGPMGGMLAMQMLGRGMGSMLPSSGAPPQFHAERSAPATALSTWGTTDDGALTTLGEAPTVLAFLYCATGASVIYEVLNEGDHATYVYRALPEERRRINRAMALLGMRVEAIYQDVSTAASAHRTAVDRLPYLQGLRGSFVGRAIHTEGWEAQLRSLV